MLREVAEAACVDLTTTTAGSMDGVAALAAEQADVWVPDGREFTVAAGDTAATAPAIPEPGGRRVAEGIARSRWLGREQTPRGACWKSQQT